MSNSLGLKNPRFLLFCICLIHRQISNLSKYLSDFGVNTTDLQAVLCAQTGKIQQRNPEIHLSCLPTCQMCQPTARRYFRETQSFSKTGCSRLPFLKSLACQVFLLFCKLPEPFGCGSSLTEITYSQNIVQYRSESVFQPPVRASEASGTWIRQFFKEKFCIYLPKMYFCTRKCTKVHCKRKILYFGKVLYGQLPSNPPGPDRSKGSWL